MLAFTDKILPSESDKTIFSAYMDVVLKNKK